MAKQKNIRHTELDLDAEAVVALEAARATPHGPERAFAKRGRPAKT
jgi:hypothetical protein